MNQKLFVYIVIAVAIFGLVVLLQIGEFGSGLVWKISNGGEFFLPLVIIAALIDSINPCAFSILLLTIAFLFSLGRMRAGILKIGAVYILGLFIIYILIGLGILETLHFFNTPHFMAKVGAAILMGLGAISIINEFSPAFPIKLKIPQSAHSKMAKMIETSSLPAAFLLGGFVGLCEFPCTGGPYLSILGLLHDKGTYLAGLGYLVLYNVIFVLPLVITLLIASNEAVLLRVQDWRKKNIGGMRLWGGIAMILLGLLIFAL